MVDAVREMKRANEHALFKREEALSCLCSLAYRSWMEEKGLLGRAYVASTALLSVREASVSARALRSSSTRSASPMTFWAKRERGWYKHETMRLASSCSGACRHPLHTSMRWMRRRGAPFALARSSTLRPCPSRAVGSAPEKHGYVRGDVEPAASTH